jgi:protein-disulfide isomerase
MNRMFAVCVIALCLASVALGQGYTPTPPATTSGAKAEELPSKATVESFLKHWFGYDPSLSTEVGEIGPSEIPGVAKVVVGVGSGSERKSMVLYVMPDQKYAIVGDVIPFGADPFAHARHLLAKSTTGIAKGPANSSLTIVEFSDLECPHCKAAQPTVDRLLADFPNARFVFQQFPLEAVHPWSLKAAEWAECVGRENNAAYWKFVQSVYEDQLNIDPQNADAKLKEHAVAAGAPAAATQACVANPETARRINESIELGKEVGVNGTPTLFINGRKIVGATSIPYEMLKSLTEYASKRGE